MLRMTMSKSAEGAKKYYSEEYYSEGSSRADYYSEQQHVIGKWGGKAAGLLGLQADIIKTDFSKLYDNINPSTGKSLTGRNDKDRRVGYDLTFNASKSVSLAYTFASETEKAEILHAFRNAVNTAMSEVETGMQARVRARGSNNNRETGNIVYGEFTHFTTRPVGGIPDPHLHSHCFVLNATYDNQDKKWKAGQFGQIVQDAPYYEAIFHSKLAANLEQLGYRVERTINGFELTGVEKATIHQFSRRTKEIENYAHEHSITDDKQKSQIGAKTREAKRVELTPEQYEKEWQSRISGDELYRLQNLRILSKDFTPKSNSDNAAKDALQFSLEHHLERKSVASEKEILATAIRKGVGVATHEQIRNEYDKNANILTATENLRTFITTRDALKEEKLLIHNCIESKSKFRPINENYIIHNDMLNDQQTAAVKHALSSADGIMIITGKAGTGKTTLMKEVQKGIVESGKRIYAFAPSSEASRGVQRSEGFKNADTVARLSIDRNLQADLKGQVIWIDEAGMLSNKDMNGIVAIAKEQKARIILSGDTKQHNSVQRGDALRIIEKYGGIKSITVSKIQRQKNAEYKDAVKYLSDGLTEKGFKKLESIDAVHEINDTNERLKTIAKDYYQSAYKQSGQLNKEVLVVSPTHAEGQLVTEHIRSILKEKDIIGKTDKQFTTLKNRQFTEAEKQQPENYAQGSIIVFHQHSKGIKAGSRLEVMGYEGDKLMARNDKGIPFDVPFSEQSKFSVFEKSALQIAKGDKIRITANGKAKDGKHLFNGTCYTIHGFDKEGNIKLSNGSTIASDFGHFNLGYVSTSHSSQGKTADKIILSQSTATYRAASTEQFYVSISRGRQAVTIYTDDKEQLKQAIAQTTQRQSATELLSNSEKLKAAANEQNRLSIFKKMREKTAEVYSQLKTKKQAHELQRTTRTSPGKAR